MFDWVLNTPLETYKILESNEIKTWGVWQNCKKNLMSRFRESWRMPVILFGHNINFTLEIGSAIYQFSLNLILMQEIRIKFANPWKTLFLRNGRKARVQFTDPLTEPRIKFKKTLSSRRILNFREKKQKYILWLATRHDVKSDLAAGLFKYVSFCYHHVLKS